MQAISFLSNLLFPPLPSFTKLEAPKDEEGFIISFSLEDQEGARAFFDRYGFVIFRDVLSEEEAEAAMDEIWKTMEENPSIHRDSPPSWANFPKGGAGIVGNRIADGVQAWNIRQHPKVYEGFKTILQADDLLSSLDRYGLMRPTRAIPFPSSPASSSPPASSSSSSSPSPSSSSSPSPSPSPSPAAPSSSSPQETHLLDKPEWKTLEQWFHWDLNPWSFFRPTRFSEEEDREIFKIGAPVRGKRGKEEEEEEVMSSIWEDPFALQGQFISENNSRPKIYFDPSPKVQGLVALLESSETSGGFTCVPGFHDYLPTWVQRHPQRRGGSGFVPIGQEEEEIISAAQKITMRRGSLVIWSSALPHCNYPNDGPSFRACCYVKMFPRSVYGLPWLQGVLRDRARAVRALMPGGVEVSELGKRLFGFDLL